MSANHAHSYPTVGSTILGVAEGPFKLNAGGSSSRRRGRSCNLHLARVKPNVVENGAIFSLLTPMADIEPGEFLYRERAGYLTITNVSQINGSLLEDTDAIGDDAYSIDMSNPELEQGPVRDMVATTFYSPRVY